MYRAKVFLMVGIVILSFVKAQTKEDKVLYQMREYYQDFKKNDSLAMPHVVKLIGQSKYYNNNKWLVQAYKDAVMYSPYPYQKLVYADSTITTALRSRDPDLMTTAYLGKGIVYYSNYKKYQLALDQYLKAFSYSQNIKDDYLRYKVLYHIGVVKNYLAYYEESSKHFNDCIAYFEKKIRLSQHPNHHYNYTKGYTNSLHQLAIAQQYLGHQKQSDSIVRIGLSLTVGQPQFEQEYALFLKSKAIAEFYHQSYDRSINDLNQSLVLLDFRQDYVWIALIHFYLGENYHHKGDLNRALMHNRKVDSIFVKHSVIIPEIKQNFEHLMRFSQKNQDIENQLYYTSQLLKADSIIAKDFRFLSTKIHTEFDTQKLLAEKKKLERSNEFRNVLVIVLGFIGLALLYLYLRWYYKERKINKKYQSLKHRMSTAKTVMPDLNTGVIRKSVLPEMVYKELNDKIISFEQELQFKDSSINLNTLAAKLGTNSSYLSIFINETKGMNFKRYLNGLRIEYITRLLTENKKYQNYTIEALAQECGMLTRQNFSNFFLEINGIRPIDYIRKLKEEQEST